MKKYKSVFKEKKYSSSLIDLYEDIINPKLYLNNIERKLDKALYKVRGKNYSLNKLCFILGFYFANERIKIEPQGEIFEGDEYNIYGINSGACLSDKKVTIGIFCNSNLLQLQFKDNNYINEFKKWFLYVLKHELIHRGQKLEIKNVKIRAMINSNNKILKDELKEPQEIMARAWEIVEYFRIIYNMSKNKILQIINNTDDITFGGNRTLFVYMELFNHDSKEIKLLYKYMYLYTTKGI
jgi:hypothetical protein